LIIIPFRIQSGTFVVRVIGSLSVRKKYTFVASSLTSSISTILCFNVMHVNAKKDIVQAPVIA